MTKLAKIVADFTTSLATKLAAGASTCSLQSITDDDGETLDNGTYFFTIDGDNAQKEHFVATLTGTSLSNIKSISRKGVQTANAVREHRIGASVTITNFAHIKYLNDLFDGTTDLDADNPLAYDADPDLTGNNKKLATVKLVEDTAIAGGADASTTVKGISKLSVAPASATEPIAVGDNDNRVSPVDLSSLDANKVAALAGTSGTPSASNKYVTNDDTATAATANKVARRLAGGNITVVTESAGNNSTNAASTAYVDAATLITFDSVNVKAREYALLAATTGVTSGSGSVSKQIDYLLFTPTATASNSPYIILGGVNTSKAFTIEFYANMTAAPSENQFFIGLSDNNNHIDSTNNARIGFRWRFSGSNRLTAETANGSARTQTNLSSSFTSTWVKLKMVYNLTDVKFYVNDVLETTISTNIPSTVTNFTAFLHNLTGGATAGNGYLPYYSFNYTQTR